jgi:hypothetical protein
MDTKESENTKQSLKSYKVALSGFPRNSLRTRSLKTTAQYSAVVTLTGIEDEPLDSVRGESN